jgi:hypothetical protein
VAAAVFLVLAAVAGGLLELTKIVTTAVMEFEGEPVGHWREDLSRGDAAASNRANVILNTKIIPGLSAAALHDTNDSGFKLWVVDALNGLPGVRVRFLAAPARRADDIKELGKFGSTAQSAIPVLIQVLKGNDDATRGAAAEALGEIHSDADVCVPALIACLEGSDIDDTAAEALGKFGPLAKAAVPKLLPLLLHGGKEARRAAILALPKIDPETAAKAGITERNLVPLEMSKPARAEAIKAWAAAEKPK